MCWCNSSVRTPCCGSDDCHWVAGVSAQSCPWCGRHEEGMQKEVVTTLKVKKLVLETSTQQVKTCVARPGGLGTVTLTMDEIKEWIEALHAMLDVLEK